MFIHFEDWSSPIFLNQLTTKNIPHGDKIIKVFASDENPNTIFKKPGLVVLEMDDSPFSSEEAYDYGDRGRYSGTQLEKKLAGYGLNDFGKRTMRALFRFSNQEGFCQAAMETKVDDKWLIDHPFGDIDGITNAITNPARENSIHLDIFFPSSLERLKSIVNFDKPDATVPMIEGTRWRMGRLNPGTEQQTPRRGTERI